MCSLVLPSNNTVPDPSIVTSEPSPNLTVPQIAMSMWMKVSRHPGMWLVAPLSRYHKLSSCFVSPSSYAKTFSSMTRRGRRSDGVLGKTVARAISSVDSESSSSCTT